MPMVEDQPLVRATDLFPFRQVNVSAGTGPVRPFGVALSVSVHADATGESVVLGYSDTLQVATVNGYPAVTSPAAGVLLGKKANTVEDSQTFPDEVAK